MKSLFFVRIRKFIFVLTLTSSILVSNAQTFTESTILQGNEVDFALWGDFNNESYLAILISGIKQDGTIFSGIYKRFETYMYGNQIITYSQQGNFPSDLLVFSATTGDCDNDGDIDILTNSAKIINGSVEYSLSIFKNTGNYNFEVQTLFTTTEQQLNIDLDLGDYDNDGDLDILASDGIIRVYRNDGNGLFSGQNEVFFNVLADKSEWQDYDSDEDLDVFIQRKDLSNNLYFSIYRNEGNNDFVEQKHIFIKGLEAGSSNWKDFNNDGFPDLLVTGTDFEGNQVIRIYLNDEGENMIEQPELSDYGFKNSCSLSGDFDNDGDPDILVSGLYYYTSHTWFYQNNYPKDSTVRNFNVSIPELSYTSLQSGDFNRDGNLDILATGNNFVKIFTNTPPVQNTPPAKPQAITCLYANNSYLDFTWKPTTDNQTPSQALSYNLRVGTSSLGNQIVPSHAYNGSALKIPISGNVGSDTTYRISISPGTYYFSVQAIDQSLLASEFSDEQQITIDSIQTSNLSATVHGDVLRLKWTKGNGQRRAVFVKVATDNDTARPVNNTGYVPSEIFRSGDQIGTSGWYCVYNGSGDSTDVYGLKVSANYLVQVIDYLGKNGTEKYFTEVSTNFGIFTIALFIKSEIYFPKKTDCYPTAWGDMDNDLDLDFCSISHIIGYILENDGDYSFISKMDSFSVYLNDNFSLLDTDKDGYLNVLVNAPNNYVANGRFFDTYSWCDFDNDGDVDWLEYNIENQYSYFPQAWFHVNNGDNTYESKRDMAFPNLESASISWVDYNSDGFADLLITGIDSISKAHTILYKNNNGSSFTKVENTPFEPLYQISGGWFDYDNDGDLDLVISGIAQNGNYSHLYANKGNDVFEEVPNVFANAIVVSDIGDYDVDGDIDILSLDNIFSNSFINSARKPYTNTIPEAPTESESIKLEDSYFRLQWRGVFSDETPEQSLSYNIAIGKHPDSLFLSTPLTTGIHRDVVSMGNCGLNNFYLAHYPVGKYYWKVQAIDGCMIGGQWSEIDSFEVKHTQALFTADTVCLGLATTFTNKSSTTDSIISYRWDFGDSSVDLIQSPTHTYALSGDYIVILTLTDASLNTDNYELIVHVRPKIKARLSVNQVCEGEESIFTNLSETDTLTAKSWYWDFGNNKSASQQDPDNLQYSKSGSYEVKLLVVSENNCADSSTAIAVVAQKPVLNFSHDIENEICENERFRMAVDYSPLYTYQWKRNDSNIFEADSNVYHVVQDSGQYEFKVEVVNTVAQCKVVSDSIMVTVKKTPFAPDIIQNSNNEICEGDSISLSANQVDNARLLWKLNGNNYQSGSTKIYAKQTGEYTLTILGDNNCDSYSQDTIDILVHPTPQTPQIALDGNSNFCKGDQVTLSINTKDFTTCNWLRNGYFFSSDSSFINCSDSGSYSLTVANLFGCETPSQNSINLALFPSISKPAIELSTNPAVLCEGETITLYTTLQKETAYQWYFNGEEIENSTEKSVSIPVKSGNYKVVCSNPGCSKESDVLTITTKPTPTQPSISYLGPNWWYLACDNMTALDYNWYVNGREISGEDNYYFDAGKQLGTYQVAVQEPGFECYAYSEVLRVPEDTEYWTSLTEQKSELEYSIVPNPGNGVFTLSIDNGYEGRLSFKVYDMSGKILFENSGQKMQGRSDFRFELDYLPSGKYIIEVQNPVDCFTDLIIIK